ncbi:hypothetical protein O3M35_010301 [Rhynocoris fuscipes]|uniref:Uncharacterized protein n=1 Tax=Rhynocoris fuscipes TaxID=488301 RepID=A0AAW1CYE2_9HEMI
MQYARLIYSELARRRALSVPPVRVSEDFGHIIMICLKYARERKRLFNTIYKLITPLFNFCTNAFSCFR